VPDLAGLLSASYRIPLGNGLFHDLVFTANWKQTGKIYWNEAHRNKCVILPEQGGKKLPGTGGAGRAGGVIASIRENGFLFKKGPNTGVLGQAEAALLFEDLGEAVELELAGNNVKKRYILKNAQWHALPSGPAA
jgi:hypothetical protein